MWSYYKKTNKHNATRQNHPWHGILQTPGLDDIINLQAVPDTISYSSAISACAKRGFWENALQLLFEMTTQRIPVNDISCPFADQLRAVGSNTLGDVVGKKFQSNRLIIKFPMCDVPFWEVHLAVVHCNPLASWPATNWSGCFPGFNAVIGACKEDGRWAEAVSLLFLMEEGSYPPDVVSDSSWWARMTGWVSWGPGGSCFPMTKPSLVLSWFHALKVLEVPSVRAMWLATGKQHWGSWYACKRRRLGFCDDFWSFCGCLDSTDTKNHRLA